MNLIQTLSLIAKPFSQTIFRRINRWAADTWWSWCDLSAKKLYRIQIILTGENLPIGENSIVILNHQSMADIPVVFSIAKEKGRLGDLKWFVKDTLKYVPGIGWGMLFLDCLFVKRDWTADREHVCRIFKKFLTDSIPLWLMIFVEGSRFRPETLRRSREYAEKNHFEPYRHLLFPRTKGFTASVDSLRTHIDAVYDLTIGYVNGTPTLWMWITGKVRSVHVHIRRFPIDQLPRQETALSQWLLERFREKDLLLDQFYKKGAFSAPS